MDFALLRTAGDWEEREEMVRGRSLETRASSLESSQRASLVSIRSSISSSSPSDLDASDEDDDEPSIIDSPEILLGFFSVSLIRFLNFFASSLGFASSYACFLSLPCLVGQERKSVVQNDVA